MKIRADSFPLIVRLLCRECDFTSPQCKQQLLQAAPPASAPGVGGGSHCEKGEEPGCAAVDLTQVTPVQGVRDVGVGGKEV